MPILFIFLLTMSFLVSGIGSDTLNLAHLSIFTALSFGFFILIKGKTELKTPPHFAPLLAFAIIAQISLLFTAEKMNPFYYSLLFCEGLSVWYLAYNLPDKITGKLNLFFMVPLFAYTFLYLISVSFGLNLLRLADNFFIVGEGYGHPQIGSLAVAASVYLIGNKIAAKTSLYNILIYLTGVYFLVISKSRSALVGLFAVLSYYAAVNEKYKKHALYLVIPVLFAGVFYISSGRSLITSRVYFAQSLAAFPENLFGVGMGNFGEISKKYYENGGALGFYSANTHNIFLEALSGLGIFSLPFFYWGYKVVKDLLNANTKSVSGWSYLFLFLFTLFLIDSTYTIPGMFLVFTASLGMVQKENLKKY